MKTITINRSDIQGAFITPPKNGGQIVTVSYARTESLILVQTIDASERSQKIEAYRASDEDDDFSPQNGAPKLGEKVGNVAIVED